MCFSCRVDILAAIFTSQTPVNVANQADGDVGEGIASQTYISKLQKILRYLKFLTMLSILMFLS